MAFAPTCSEADESLFSTIKPSNPPDVDGTQLSGWQTIWQEMRRHNDNISCTVVYTRERTPKHTKNRKLYTKTRVLVMITECRRRYVVGMQQRIIIDGPT